MLPEFPDIEVERVNVLDDPDTALARGIRLTPAFACDDKVLNGILLPRWRIRRFLRSL